MKRDNSPFNDLALRADHKLHFRYPSIIRIKFGRKTFSIPFHKLELLESVNCATEYIYDDLTSWYFAQHIKNIKSSNFESAAWNNSFRFEQCSCVISNAEIRIQKSCILLIFINSSLEIWNAFFPFFSFLAVLFNKFHLMAVNRLKFQRIIKIDTSIYLIKMCNKVSKSHFNFHLTQNSSIEIYRLGSCAKYT